MQPTTTITYWIMRAREHFRRMGVAYLIFLVSLLPASLVFSRVLHNLETRDQTRLNAVVDRTRERIERHFAEVESILRGIRGLFLASGQIRPDEWNLFLQSLDSTGSGTGFRDFGFAYRVPAAAVPDHINLVAHHIRPNYEILPRGERSEYFPIIFLRDSDVGDVKALGWDPYSDAARRGAMDEARDTGKPICTDSLLMALPDGTWSMEGHVVYLPVYKGAVQPETIEERREKLVGFVFSSFVPDQLWKSVLKLEDGSKVDFEVFKGTVGDKLVYDHHPAIAGGPTRAGAHSAQLGVHLFGGRWTLLAHTLPAFADPTTRFIIGGVAFGGLAISLTLFSLARFQARGRAAAESLNASLRKSEFALRESESRFRRLTENARDVIYRYRLEPAPGFDYVSPAVEQFSGYKPEAFYQDHELLTRLTHPEDRECVDFKPPYDRLFAGPVTLRFMREDSSILWVEARNVPVKTEDGRIVGFEGVARDITEAKFSEEAIRRSEERLGRIVETIADGVLILDHNGRVTFANAAAEVILAPDGHDHFREGLRDDPAGVDPALPSLVQLLRFSAARYAFNYTYRRKDGVTMFLAVNAAKFSIVEGQPAGVVASIRDVTAEKRAEQTLLQSQTRLRILNNILGLMAAGADVMQIAVRTVGELSRHFPNYRISFSMLNGAASGEVVCSEGTNALASLKNTRFSLPAGMGETIDAGRPATVADTTATADFSAAPDVAYLKGVRATIEQPVRHGARVAALLSFHSATPHEWVSAESVMLLEVADYLAAAFAQFDVAESRRTAEAALLAEKERLAVTLRSIADGVITTDTEGRIALMNHAAEALTGWAHQEAEGRPISEVLRIADEKTALPICDPAQRVLSGSSAIETSPGVLLVGRDGQARVVSESAAQILDPHSRLVGAVLVFRDITEKRRMESELLKTSKLESVGLLAGGIAHDFNNILSVILGNITLSKMLAAPLPTVQERLTLAEKSCLRARELTQQLLTFAKGGAPIRKAASILEIVRDATEFAISGSNVVSKTQAPEDIWPVEVDEGQISQVFNNLVINAVQAMPEGGVLSIEMENVESAPALAPGRYVHISVRDTGSGISAEHLPRIFDPYFTTKKGGNGLGLATTFAIVQKHQGAITAESAPGVGTTFHVYLPATSQPIEAKIAAQEIGPGRGGRILVMDDEPDILDMASASLRHLGYDLDTAVNGKEAIDKFVDARRRGRPFDAVIMDLTIPGGMGGKEAMRHLQEIDPSIRAIVSSGYSHDPVMANYRDYGFSGVVEKPYQVTTLAQTLAQILPRNPN